MTEFSAKYDPGVQVDAGEVLALHRNENLFAGREWTVDRARELVERAAIGTYPEATSLPLREALARTYGVGAENVFVGNGSDEVLADLLSLLRREHDALHVLDVSFKVYPLLAERLDYRMETLGGETFFSGKIEANGFTGLAVVDSPNGITGKHLDPEHVLQVGHDPRSFLIWDNVYGEYAEDRLPAKLPTNVAFVRSFSKFYALAGLRVGYCIADAALISELLARKDAFNVNGFAQVMAIDALERREQFVAMREELVGCRTELRESLEALGFEVLPSESVALLATHPNISAETLQAELLARKVAVRRFTDAAITQYVRITVAPRKTIARLMDALTEIVGM